MLGACIKSQSQEKDNLPNDSTASTYEFVLKDGTRIIGQLLDQSKESYIIKTPNFGTIKLANNQVSSMTLIDQSGSKNPNSTTYENQFGFKYFIFPTAIPVEKKNWYYTNQYLFISNFTYGITKHLSASLSFFTFVPTSFLSPSIKITVNPDSKVKFAINGQYLFVRGTTNNNAVFLQGIITSGDQHNNFTFAVGKFVSNQGGDEGSIITIGFVKKVSPKLTVISENNILIGKNSTINTGGLLSAGLRFDRRTHSFDLGLLVPTSGLDRNLNLIPYLGFNLKLSK